MKLLVVTSFFPTSTSDELPQFLLEQVKSIANYKPEMEIKVLTTSSSREGDKSLPSNISVKRFTYFYPKNKQTITIHGILPAIKNNKLNILLLPLLFIFEFFAIVKEIKSFKPDYIYSHWFLPQGLLCHFASKAFNVPHLFTSHSYDVEICKKLPILGPWFVRSAIRNMQAITVVSERTLSGISHFFKSKEWVTINEKCKIIPMGINIPEQSTIRSSMVVSKIQQFEGKDIFLFMGRFVEKKGIDELIHAFALLQKSKKNVILIIAGNGIRKKEISSLISKLNLDGKVYLPGFITTAEKDCYLERANYYVLPSVIAKEGDREGLPVSLLENMAFGNLCLATFASGAGEIIEHGKNGYLCNSGDITSLHQAMETMLLLKENEINNIKKAARLTADNYKWDIVVKKHIDHFFERM
ncbi:MAG: glycosyltransferase family 4 protein [Ignavibacteriae bacterium]|nr:glycosyltransferase family 4 protein [Ignavibacteriota bacterium]